MTRTAKFSVGCFFSLGATLDHFFSWEHYFGVFFQWLKGPSRSVT